MDYLLELKLHILGARKAATDIKQIHVETNLSLELRKRSQSNSQIHHASALPPTSHLGFRYTHPHVEDTAGIRDGLHEGLRICTAASHVETRNKKGESTIPKKNYLQWGGGAVKLCHPNITTLASLPSHLTPMTSMFSSLARSKSSLLVLSVAPNLTLRRQTALESSVAIRKTNLEARKGQQIYMT